MPDVARTLDLPSGQRFEYWKRFLAPFWPYFLRSLERESRLTMPSAFSFFLSSTLKSMRARARPSLTASAWPSLAQRRTARCARSR